MSQLPHPITGMMLLEHRRADYHRECAHHRLAMLAEQEARPRQGRKWADLLAALALVIAFSLLLLAGATATEEPPATSHPIAHLASQ